MGTLQTFEIHKNSIIIEPFFSLPETVARLTDTMESNVCRSAQYAELGDYDGKHPYRQALDDIDRTIGQLKRFRHEIQRLSKHAHRWNSDDYCDICGADGRA